MSNYAKTRRNRDARMMNMIASVIFFFGIFFFLGGAVFYAFFRDEVDLSRIVGQPPPTIDAALMPTVGAVAILPPNDSQSEGARSILATFTLPPPTNPPDFLPTNTRRPTDIPTITSTFPPATPSRTSTAPPTITPTITSTPTSTPTFTPQPTSSPTRVIPPTSVIPAAPTNTRSPFPFTKSVDSPIYLRNFANDAGCNWMGLAGEVYDREGNPAAVDAYQVHVWESGINNRVPVGGATAYGSAGWEQFLFDSPVARNYNVQLETTNGTPVSQVYQIASSANCDGNLIYIIFEQNR